MKCPNCGTRILRLRRAHYPRSLTGHREGHSGYTTCGVRAAKGWVTKYKEVVTCERCLRTENFKR
jgi:hypothetical protein